MTSGLGFKFDDQGFPTGLSYPDNWKSVRTMQRLSIMFACIKVMYDELASLFGRLADEYGKQIAKETQEADTKH